MLTISPDKKASRAGWVEEFKVMSDAKVEQGTNFDSDAWEW